MRRAHKDDEQIMVGSKQRWKHNPLAYMEMNVYEHNTLSHKILKEKYFPNSDLLSAKIGNNPSLTWRSILAGRETLKKGIYWRVGNSTRVRVWWSLDSLPKYFQSNITMQRGESRVLDLGFTSSRGVSLGSEKVERVVHTIRCRGIPFYPPLWLYSQG